MSPAIFAATLQIQAAANFATGGLSLARTALERQA